jgi:hypothetical protein
MMERRTRLPRKKIKIFIISALLILFGSVSLSRIAHANPIGGYYPHYPPPCPQFTVNSPANNTSYPADLATLNFNVSTVPWIAYFAGNNDPNHAYSLAYSNIQCWIDNMLWNEFNYSESSNYSTPITWLSVGRHSIELNASTSGEYWKVVGTDAQGYNYNNLTNGISTGSSGKIYFTIEQPRPNSNPPTTQKPPTPSLDNQQQQSAEMPLISMPVEYVNYTISNVNGTLWATVDGTYPMHISPNWVNQELPMVYPTPPETTNIIVKLNGQEMGWNNYTQFYPDAVHYTYLGNWNMIITAIQPTAADFLLTIHYQHPVEQANGSYLFLYDLNISPYLSEASNSSVAHFTIRFENNASNIQVYTVPGDSSEPRDNAKTPVYFTTSQENNATVVTFSIISSQAKPVPGDELVIFQQNDIQVPEFSPWTAFPLLFGITFAVFFKQRRRKKKTETHL